MATRSRYIALLVTSSWLAVLVAAGCVLQMEEARPILNTPLASRQGEGGSALRVSQPSPPADMFMTTTSPIQLSPSSTPPSMPNSRSTATPFPAPPTPSPAPTPMPALRQISRGECCTQPFWSSDSRLVLYIDKPRPDTPTGIWGVEVSQADPTPELITERIAFYSADLSLVSKLDQDSTVIERLQEPLPAKESPSSEQTWKVDTGGRPVSISPGQKRIAWEVSDEDLPSERRVTQIWVANLDGSNPQMVISLPRGGLSGWISDDELLLSGRESLQSREQIMFALSLTDGHQLELARGERLRGGILSPGGEWLAYFVALDKDAEKNGLWLVRTDGSQRQKLEQDLFGAYQWRDERRLLTIPFRPEATSHEIWEFDTSTGQTRQLTNPQVTPFKIANGDWSVSPDGRYIAFVESRDRNIWLLTLPD